MRGDSTKMVCKELNGWRRVMSVSEYRSFRTLGRFCAKLCTDRNDWATFCLGPAWSITNYDHKWWTINIGVLLQGALTPNGKGVHFFTARSQITYVYRVTAFVQHPSQIAHGAQSIPVKVARRLHNQQLKACECCGSPQPSAFNIYIHIFEQYHEAPRRSASTGPSRHDREEDLIFKFGVLVLNYSWLKLTCSGCIGLFCWKACIGCSRLFDDVLMPLRCFMPLCHPDKNCKSTRRKQCLFFGELLIPAFHCNRHHDVNACQTTQNLKLCLQLFINCIRSSPFHRSQNKFIIMTAQAPTCRLQTDDHTCTHLMHDWFSHW